MGVVDSYEAMNKVAKKFQLRFGKYGARNTGLWNWAAQFWRTPTYMIAWLDVGNKTTPGVLAWLERDPTESGGDVWLVGHFKDWQRVTDFFTGWDFRVFVAIDGP